LLVAGLTGGIASGKSTVSAFFQKAGAKIIDADSIARQVVAPGLPAWKAIQSAFGDDVILSDGAIDRVLLGELVFSDRRLRRQLEGIIHPHVRLQINRELIWLRRTTPKAVVIQDIPLLLETGMTEGLAEIIVVYAPPELQLKRLMLRDGIDLNAARARLDAQMPMAEKRRRATIVIDNSGALPATRQQAIKIYEDLARRAQKDV
jgi:dephospho-CoA kinase